MKLVEQQRTDQAEINRIYDIKMVHFTANVLKNKELVRNFGDER